ncbi:hypothetical protein FPQ18DRAFT_386286 [Pyronema domesticum]|nr:hypothetical protein FPQ18DRAFT_386286 [Pyronema domesticum]
MKSLIVLSVITAVIAAPAIPAPEIRNEMNYHTIPARSSGEVRSGMDYHALSVASHANRQAPPIKVRDETNYHAPPIRRNTEAQPEIPDEMNYHVALHGTDFSCRYGFCPVIFR